MKNAADFIVSYLLKHGVRRVYGYLGATVTPFLQAIERSQQHSKLFPSDPSIRFILVRNEFNAALAASAEAKLTCKLAVCTATAGPGSIYFVFIMILVGVTNMITGIVDAKFDRAPVLVITGDIPTFKQGRTSEFQELKQSTLYESVVSTTTTISHLNSIPTILRVASSCIGFPNNLGEYWNCSVN